MGRGAGLGGQNDSSVEEQFRPMGKEGRDGRVKLGKVCKRAERGSSLPNITFDSLFRI